MASKQAFAVTVSYYMGEEHRFSMAVIVDINKQKAEARAAKTVAAREPGARIGNVLVMPLDLARIQEELRR
ncbi:hypothetical protein LPC08_08900 [Roseomonas sp. OT10]|uniref:hypothetical protein n=1 Tax=Roseomonas cutis TaxID=2897332 RepID=UPI001E359420|nr:hypothetical protein [Roseomonas sp. OT10]UFN50711.1 hypothetical protein LPC08_08900 [Roseomonas sp. OT10]